MNKKLLLTTLSMLLTSGLTMASEPGELVPLRFSNDMTTGHSVLVRTLVDQGDEGGYRLVSERCIMPGREDEMLAVIGLNNRFDVLVQKKLNCNSETVYQESYEINPDDRFMNGKIRRLDNGKYSIEYKQL